MIGYITMDIINTIWYAIYLYVVQNPQRTSSLILLWSCNTNSASLIYGMVMFFRFHEINHPEGHVHERLSQTAPCLIVFKELIVGENIRTSVADQPAAPT